MIEPRRLAARAAASRLAASLQEPLGERIGFAVRGEQRRSAQTQVEVITDGLFLRRLRSDPSLEGEVHFPDKDNCTITDKVFVIL